MVLLKVDERPYLKEAVHEGKGKKPYRTDFGILIPGYRIDAVDYESAKNF